MDIYPGTLGQDLWVLERLQGKRHGFFIEAGAHDGVFASNTIRLERDFGWTGLLIEPNPRLAAECRRSRKSLVIEAAVAAFGGPPARFVDADNMGCLEEHVDSDMFGDERRQTTRAVVVVRLLDLNEVVRFAAAMGMTELDYLSIDIEGGEFDALRTFDFQAHAPKLVTVEHNYVADRRAAISYLLQSNGYTRSRSVDCDDWFERA
jgi:FkbM family methyltransferase